MKIFRKRQKTLMLKVLEYLYPHFGVVGGIPMKEFFDKLDLYDIDIHYLLERFKGSNLVKFTYPQYRLGHVGWEKGLPSLTGSIIQAEILPEGKEFFEAHIRQMMLISNSNWDRIAIIFSIISVISSIFFGWFTMKNASEIDSLKKVIQTQNSTIENLNKAASFRSK